MRRDLTSGNPIKTILQFCVPLFIGNLFQQMYSIVDSIIIGRHLGVEAFAAIGSTGSLNVLIIGFATGLCSGLCIPIAQNYGAGNIPALRQAEANGLYIAGFVSILISVSMFFFTTPILQLLNTPQNILKDASSYIGTLFMGSGGLILYNLVIGYMRALGDSKTPFFFLILAAILNILLDILFIMVLNIGIIGAALATILAQLSSALLAILTIRRNFPVLHLNRSVLKPSFPVIGRLAAISLPIGLQSSITAIGSIALQIAINGLGAAAVAAMAVGGKVHAILLAPMDALGVSVVIFTCQNFGAGKLDRIRKGLSQLMLASTGYALFCIGITWVGGRFFAEIFLSASETEIHNITQSYLRISIFFFLTLNVLYIYRNALQGIGYSNAAMGSGLCEMVARISVALFVVPALGFTGACLASPFAWTLAALFLVPMYFYASSKLQKQHALQHAALEEASLAVMEPVFLEENKQESQEP